MKKSKLEITYLVISGFILTMIGVGTLLFPATLKAESGLNIIGNIAALNEARAFGALLTGIAFLVVKGIFKSQSSQSSIQIATVAFLAIGIGRSISILFDGMPLDSVLKATALEFIIGSFGLVLMYFYARSKTTETIHSSYSSIS